MITVVGCGGDRDKTKRATMAQRAPRLRPRHPHERQPTKRGPRDHPEGHGTRLDPIEKRKCLSIVDRREAIRTAAALTEAGDMSWSPEKGTKRTRNQGERLPFDDRLELKKPPPTT